MALTWEFRNSLVGCMKRWSLAILLHELLRTHKQIFTRIFKFLPFLYVSILQAALSQIDGEYLLEVACPRKKLLVLQWEASMLDIAMIDWMFPSPPIGNDQVWDCDDWHLREVMHAALPGWNLPAPLHQMQIRNYSWECASRHKDSHLPLLIFTLSRNVNTMIYDL